MGGWPVVYGQEIAAVSESLCGYSLQSSEAYLKYIPHHSLVLD